MITKEMLKRCLNPEMQAFCALDEDVRDAIFNNNHYERLFVSGSYDRPILRWEKVGGFNYDQVVRLSPDTPTEPEYEDYNVMIDVRGFTYLSVRDTGNLPLFTAITHSRFLGIIYTLNGVETLRTSVDASFGTPVRVRFAKEEK